MYLTNSSITIEWVLGMTPNTLLVSDLDIITVDPDKSVEYLTAPIAIGDFTAPTATTEGLASYVIQPNSDGLWTVRVVVGTINSHQILSELDLQVQTGQTTVNPPEIH